MTKIETLVSEIKSINCSNSNKIDNSNNTTMKVTVILIKVIKSIKVHSEIMPVIILHL